MVASTLPVWAFLPLAAMAVNPFNAPHANVMPRATPAPDAKLAAIRLSGRQVDPLPSDVEECIDAANNLDLDPEDLPPMPPVLEAFITASPDVFLAVTDGCADPTILDPEASAAYQTWSAEVAEFQEAHTCDLKLMFDACGGMDIATEIYKDPAVVCTTLLDKILEATNCGEDGGPAPTGSVDDDEDEEDDEEEGEDEDEDEDDEDGDDSDDEDGSEGSSGTDGEQTGEPTEVPDSGAARIGGVVLAGLMGVVAVALT